MRSRERAVRVNADDKNINDIVALLRALRRTAADDADADDEAFDALCGLERFFATRLRAGELAKSRVRAAQAKEDGAVGADAEATYAAWFVKHYKAFIERAMDVMVDGTRTARVRVLALAVIMECVRCETPGAFANELYDETLKRCVTSSTLSEELLGALKARYLTRIDVRYYTYASLRKIIEDLREGKGLRDDEASALDVARNVYDVLNATPRDFEDYRADGDGGGAQNDDFAAMLAKIRGATGAGGMGGGDDDEPAMTAPWCKEESTAAADAETPKKKRKTASSTAVKSKWMDGKRHRKLFSETWVALLRADFPEDIYRKILMRLHVDVMPHMVNAQLLSDFCINSIDIGGLTGMLALNGLFILMTQHGLEYTAFYNRLYELLDASCFHANHRRGFFQLMDVFLKSPALPAYLVASFIKRFSRLALKAPPAGVMVCIGFIHNLLRRHKSCAVLVHRESRDGEPLKLIKSDPFDADENDPSKTNALKSSLWEMETMRTHYFPQIPKMVVLLERDLTDRVKTKELEMGDLVAAAYGTLMREELDVRMKKVPLATHVEPFTSLFATPDMKRCFDAFATTA